MSARIAFLCLSAGLLLSGCGLFAATVMPPAPIPTRNAAPRIPITPIRNT